MAVYWRKSSLSSAATIAANIGESSLPNNTLFLISPGNLSHNAMPKSSAIDTIVDFSVRENRGVILSYQFLNTMYGSIVGK